jgi:hypothetical protein
MKGADIEILEETIAILRKHIPLSEYDAYARFLDYYERMKAKNDAQKQQYQDKADYHRETSRKWRQDNKEKHYAYQKEYNAKKRAAEIGNVDKK